MSSRTAPAKAKPKSKKAAKGPKRATGASKPKKTVAAKPHKKAAPRASEGGASKGSVKLLSGGNPQIAKGDGDAPVQAYIEAMPGWKRGLGQQLDAIIERAVPKLQKAVKWNSPMYGVQGQGYFLGVHCFTKYVKVAFFRGAKLKPLPPGASKDKNTRYLDIYEDEEFDQAQFAKWVKQAAALPGWTP